MQIFKVKNQSVSRDPANPPLRHSASGSVRGIPRWLILSVAIILLLLLACAVYLSRYYRTDSTALEALDGSAVTIVREHDQILFLPEVPIAGLIFYPGANVEYTAYSSLLQQLAQHGILCISVRMPHNMAFLDSDAAASYPKRFPDIENWYLCGHSLGGSMAASFAEKGGQLWRGLILLASYSTEDLTDNDLPVLSIYGSEDGVLNRSRYDRNFSNLPEDVTEIVIPGGCHAWFGNYGVQKGDGTPTISPEEQQSLTADAILELISES